MKYKRATLADTCQKRTSQKSASLLCSASILALDHSQHTQHFDVGVNALLAWMRLLTDGRKLETWRTAT